MRKLICNLGFSFNTKSYSNLSKYFSQSWASACSFLTFLVRKTNRWTLNSSTLRAEFWAEFWREKQLMCRWEKLFEIFSELENAQRAIEVPLTKFFDISGQKKQMETKFFHIESRILSRILTRKAVIVPMRNIIWDFLSIGKRKAGYRSPPDKVEYLLLISWHFWSENPPR